jgi:enoyl-CoA hydratase
LSEPTYVRVERDEEIAIVYIDRQDKLNALNSDVITQLSQAFLELSGDDSIRGVVLTGAGEKAFVAGADIGVLAKMDSLNAVRISREGQEVFRMIERFPSPVLAAIGGYALGGGLELALACHMRIASDNARMGLPEVGLGIIPGYGGTIRLARLVGLGRAVELTLTGEMVSAEQARELGLVTDVVPRASLVADAIVRLRKVTKNGPVAVRMALESVYRALDTSMEEALAFESTLFGVLASTEDMAEGMAAFMEKRAPEFKGR